MCNDQGVGCARVDLTGEIEREREGEKGGDERDREGEREGVADPR